MINSILFTPQIVLDDKYYDLSVNGITQIFRLTYPLNKKSSLLAGKRETGEFCRDFYYLILVTELSLLFKGIWPQLVLGPNSLQG